MRKIVTHRTLREGDILPRWWGVAWHDYACRSAILMPIPLNWLAGWGRMVYYWLARGPRDRLEDRILDKLKTERAEGFHHGYKDGHRDGWNQVNRLVNMLGPDIGDSPFA